MQKINKQKLKTKHMLSFLLAVFCFLIPIFSLSSSFVYAENTTYSNVLEDLQKDENFNAEDYPVAENDYSLKVIQIAESLKNELLIYVYQPAITKELKATKISIFTDENKLSYKIYHLEFLNSDGVFQKYRVKGFVVSKDIIRTYDVTSIFRIWDKDIDKDTGNDNTINEVVFAVAKIWQIMTFNSKVYYSCYDTETIEIIDKYVGFVRYYNGYLSFKACDAHFVAFSTDKDIDKLLDIDVYFVVQKMCSEYRLIGGYNEWSYGSESEKEITLSYLDKATNKSSWLFGQKATWDRIQTPSDFIKNKNLKKEVEEKISTQDWVLNFYETIFDDSSTHYTFFSKVSEVSILRLKFETNGVVYNLGVVDNMQTGSGKPVNIPKSLWGMIWPYLLGGILAIIGIILFIAFMPRILSFVFKCIKKIGDIVVLVWKGLIWLLTSPFSIIT